MAKRYNNYTISIICATLVGIPIGIILLIFSCFVPVGIPPWLLDIVFPFVFISHLISGVSTTTRLLDVVLGEETLFDVCKNTFKKMVSLKTYVDMLKRISGKNLFEFTALILGITAAIALSVFQIVFHVNLPGAAFFPTAFSGIILCVLNIGSFANFFVRCARVLDYIRNNAHHLKFDRDSVKSFFRQHDINYTLGVVGGLLVGIIACTLIVSLVGATSVATMGGIIPVWAGCALFCISTVASFTSFGSYATRALGSRSITDFIIDGKLPSLSTQLTTEQVFTIVGIVVGLGLAITLVALGVTTLPFFGSGLPPIVGGITLFMTCVSGSASMFNRWGRAIGLAIDQPTLPPEEIINHTTSPPQLDNDTPNIIIEEKLEEQKSTNENSRIFSLTSIESSNSSDESPEITLKNNDNTTNSPNFSLRIFAPTNTASPNASNESRNVTSENDDNVTNSSNHSLRIFAQTNTVSPNAFDKSLDAPTTLKHGVG